MKKIWGTVIAVLAVALVGYVGLRAFGSEDSERDERGKNEVAAQAADPAFERAESAPNEKAEHDGDEHAENQQSEQLAKAVQGAKVRLLDGLQAASAVGTPISAKFEIDEGAFQLSVYVANGGSFSEVIVDHQTGKVAKTEAITAGDDLEEAKAQSAAMAGANRSLVAAVQEGLARNKGFLATGAVPALEEGRPVVRLTLAKGQSLKTVDVPLGAQQAEPDDDDD